MEAMKHVNFYSFTATNNYNLGRQMGSAFKDTTNRSLKRRKSIDWESRKNLSQGFLQSTEKHFPEYIQELKGYATGASIDFIGVL